MEHNKELRNKSTQICPSEFFLSSLENMHIDFREKGGGGEREGNIDVREKHQLVAPCTQPEQGPNPKPKHVP